jgi:hypothetical protein
MRQLINMAWALGMFSLLSACQDDAAGSGGNSAAGAGMAGAPASGGVTAGSAGSATPPSGGSPSAGGVAGGAGTATVMGGAGAGTAGGAAAGAGGTGGTNATACDPKNVCDGFEAAGLGAWKQNGMDGTVKVDATHAFAGQQAMQFVSLPGSNKRTQLERTGAPLFPAANNVLWGRVMAYAQELPGMSDKEDKNVHYDLIQASGEQPGEYRVAGMGGVLLNYEPHDCYFGTQKHIK